MPIVIEHNLSPIIGGLAAYRAGKGVGAQQIAGYKAAQQQQIGGALAQGVSSGFQAGYGRETQMLLQQQGAAAQAAARAQAAGIDYDQFLYKTYGIRSDELPQRAQDAGFGADTREYLRFLDDQRSADAVSREGRAIKSLAPIRAEAQGQIDAARYGAQYKAQYDARTKYAEDLAEQGLIQSGMRRLNGEMLGDSTEVVAEFSPKQYAQMSEIHNKIAAVDQDPTATPEDKWTALEGLYKELGAIRPAVRYAPKPTTMAEQFVNDSTRLPGTDTYVYQDRDGKIHNLHAVPIIPEKTNTEWVAETKKMSRPGGEFEQEYMRERERLWTEEYNSLPLTERKAREGSKGYAADGKTQNYTFDDYKLEKFLSEQDQYRKWLKERQARDSAENASIFMSNRVAAEQINKHATPHSGDMPEPQDQSSSTGGGGTPTGTPRPDAAPAPSSQSGAIDPKQAAQAAATVLSAPKDLRKMTREQWNELMRSALTVKQVQKNGNPAPQPGGR